MNPSSTVGGYLEPLLRFLLLGIVFLQWDIKDHLPYFNPIGSQRR